MDAISKAELVARYTWDSMRWLANHQLLGEAYWSDGAGARWEIGEPDTTIHRCEIIAGTGGTLIVHGDFAMARFAYSDRYNAWYRLLWMADCRDVGYYVAQKARIGMGSSIAHYDERVALYDIRKELTELRTGDYNPRLIALLEEAIQDRHLETEHQLRTFLNEHDEGWDLWERSYGEVVPPHLVTQYVALNKCAWLLREKHGDEGPPACRRPK